MVVASNLFFCAAILFAPCHFSSRAQDQNRLRFQYQRVERKYLDKYKVRRKQVYIYQAASRLWAEGVQWSRALDVVTSAFDAVMYEG